MGHLFQVTFESMLLFLGSPIQPLPWRTGCNKLAKLCETYTVHFSLSLSHTYLRVSMPSLNTEESWFNLLFNCLTVSEETIESS